MTATHEQESSEPSAEWRALVKRGADLCRRDPALWSRTVLYQDQLIAAGMDRQQAHERALTEAGA